MKKEVFALLLASCMVLSALSACSPAPTTDSGNRTPATTQSPDGGSAVSTPALDSGDITSTPAPDAVDTSPSPAEELSLYVLDAAAPGTPPLDTSDWPEIPISHFTYKYNEKYQGIAIYEYLGAGTKVRVPDMIDGEPVVVIDGAFVGNPIITAVYLPDNLKFLGDETFRGCSSLASFNIPSGLSELGDDTFYDCRAIKSITIPDNITVLGSCVFLDCETLEDITLPDTLRLIGEGVFSNTCWYNNQPDGYVYLDNCLIGYKGEMPEFTHVDIPEGTKVMCGGMFIYAFSLETVTLPDGLVGIGGDTFSYSSLTSVNLPESLVAIGEKAFHDCTNLDYATKARIREIQIDSGSTPNALR